MPWLALRLLPPSLASWRARLQWLAALSFYAMKGPRVAVSRMGSLRSRSSFLMIVALLLRQESLAMGGAGAWGWH